jgi:hypothetical protein
MNKKNGDIKNLSEPFEIVLNEMSDSIPMDETRWTILLLA